VDRVTGPVDLDRGGQLQRPERRGDVRPPLAGPTRRRVAPLLDKSGNPFSYGVPDEVLRLSEEISRWASGNIAVPEQVTNPGTRDRHVVSSLIEESITSSQLEGAATSRQVAKEMIRSGRPPRDRSERMILNNYHAMERVRELRDADFTPEPVCELHRIVTDGTLDDPSAAGRLQSDPDPRQRVAVTGDHDQILQLHLPPPVGELPDRLDRLCAFANETSDAAWMQPVLRSLAVHFMVGYDHYFEDGNGRTARALFYWSMLKRGYWLTEFLTISRILNKAPAQYARSYLFTEQDGGDLTYFFLYHLNVIRRAIDDLDAYLARKVRELRATRVPVGRHARRVQPAAAGTARTGHQGAQQRVHRPFPRPRPRRVRGDCPAGPLGPGIQGLADPYQGGQAVLMATRTGPCRADPRQPVLSRSRYSQPVPSPSRSRPNGSGGSTLIGPST
jgi:Fic family protein